ncbi:translation initiation factor IF-2-like [Mustela putorius furo]|uniref:Translation initiation factor IF-2-like n=1 Tax=Mustela putorius furo TaxID=9669 RepID=A0A8U0REU5_MUSPF|nr:translation initiation factor IF-2-like [Mustela putorius furo]
MSYPPWLRHSPLPRPGTPAPAASLPASRPRGRRVRADCFPLPAPAAPGKGLLVDPCHLPRAQRRSGSRLRGHRSRSPPASHRLPETEPQRQTAGAGAGQSSTQPALEPAWPDLAAASPTWALPRLGIGPQEPERLRRPVRGPYNGWEVGEKQARPCPTLRPTNSSPGGSQGPPQAEHQETWSSLRGPTHQAGPAAPILGTRDQRPEHRTCLPRCLHRAQPQRSWRTSDPAPGPQHRPRMEGAPFPHRRRSGLDFAVRDSSHT